jgi:hypothetical protein
VARVKKMPGHGVAHDAQSKKAEFRHNPAIVSLSQVAEEAQHDEIGGLIRR